MSARFTLRTCLGVACLAFPWLIKTRFEYIIRVIYSMASFVIFWSLLAIEHDLIVGPAEVAVGKPNYLLIVYSELCANSAIELS